jgi:6-phosphofructokinase 1
MKANKKSNKPDKIFISFPFDEVYIATYIAQQLKKNSNNDFEISIYPQNVNGIEHWKDQIISDIKSCNIFIFIVGEQINDGQLDELKVAISAGINIWRINTVSGNNAWSQALTRINQHDIHKILETDFESWDSDGKLDLDGTVSNLFRNNRINWKNNNYMNDGLPLNSQIFNYEKKIIDFYYNHNNFSTCDNNLNSFDIARDKILLGVPSEWPKVRIKKERPRLVLENLDENVQAEIGDFREDSNYVLSAALSAYHQKDKSCPCDGENKLIFPEAGPRKLVFSNAPMHNLRIGILVSGGIAPGINALIDGITRRHYFYANKLGYTESLEILGLVNGFNSLELGNQIQYKHLYPTEDKRPEGSIITSKITNEGGSIIGTSRYQPLVDDDFHKRQEALYHIVVRLRNEGIRILYIIGGEGSMKAALAIQKRADQYVKDENIGTSWDLIVVGIPKTMDNDILWVWQTFGFMSAVEKAREFIESLYVESKSNPRWGIVQLFGSNSGFVVSHAVLACKSDICNLALIPEMDYNLKNIVKYIRESGKDNGLIILAETAVPKDVANYLNKPEIIEILTRVEKEAIKEYRTEMRKIDCHVNDHLRSGVVKIIAWAIENEAGKKRPFINEPRHLLRSIPPSTIDIITASRLGTLAVDNAMAGYYGFMISQWLTEFCLVPLELVVLGRKRIPPEGIFFKSVIKKTGQPQNLMEKE